MSSAVRVRALDHADLTSAARLHRCVLDMEFLSRYGQAFMRTYYQAWVEAPQGIALAAVDEHDTLVGALLGAVDPAAHTRGMVRQHGVRLGTRLAVQALGHPALAKDLIVTRGRRYVRGLSRLAAAQSPRRSELPTAGTGGPAVGVITHLAVHPDRQRSGIGRALVDAAVTAGRNADLDELVLVTPPDLAARTFYERLGWLAGDEVTSQSGEAFLRYRFPLAPNGPQGSTRPPRDVG
jgi:ribosomal protein S18 acetylase RimI-like enzyme